VAGWPYLPWAFPWVLAITEEAWRLRALAGVEDVNSYVTAVAVCFGVEHNALDWHVEAEHGWEPHDTGYGQAVWTALWCIEHGALPRAQSRFRPAPDLVRAAGVPWLFGRQRCL
jgi:hypothetical protein